MGSPPERGEYAQSEAQLSEHYLPVVLKRGLLFPTRHRTIKIRVIDRIYSSIHAPTPFAASSDLNLKITILPVRGDSPSSVSILSS